MKEEWRTLIYNGVERHGYILSNMFRLYKQHNNKQLHVSSHKNYISFRMSSAEHIGLSKAVAETWGESVAACIIPKLGEEWVLIGTDNKQRVKIYVSSMGRVKRVCCYENNVKMSEKLVPIFREYWHNKTYVHIRLNAKTKKILLPIIGNQT